MQSVIRRIAWPLAAGVCLQAFAAAAAAQGIEPSPPPIVPIVGEEQPESVQRSPFATTRPGSTDWAQVIGNSLRLVSLEHMTRVILQPDTRRALSGPFVADYLQSIRRPEGWNDGNAWAVNYIGHPIHGAAAGFVWIAAQRDRAVPLEFSRRFWSSRGAAALWAAAYSLQFELGPLSEASIGNVGMQPGTTGWVDHVMTPVGAFGFMVLEDWVDQTVIIRVERSTGNVFVRAVIRVALNPSRSMSAMAQGQMPWTRSDRNLR
jgi:hypothetical protein